MFFLLVFSIFSKKVIFKMDSKNRIYSLPDFGFEKGGRLYITFFGLNFTGIKLFVLSPILRDIFYHSSNTAFFCTSSLDFFFVEFRPHYQGFQSEHGITNFTSYVNDIYNNSYDFKIETNDLNILSRDFPSYNTGIGYIAINVTVPNVYLPILTNCEQQNKVAAIVQYTNNESFLDTREKRIQLLYTTLVFIYFFIMLIWIANGLLYPFFSISIHYLFTFSCLSKLFSLYFSCLKWKELQKVETVSNMVKYGEIFFRCFSFTVLITTCVSASLGFGIYRQSDALYVFLVILVSASLFLSILIVDENFKGLRLFGLSSGAACFIVLVQIVRAGAGAATSIFAAATFRARSLSVVAKANLVVSFCYSLAVILIVYASVFALSLACSSRMMKSVTVECAESLFFAVGLLFFAYRRSYKPLESGVVRWSEETVGDVFSELDAGRQNGLENEEDDRKVISSNNCRVVVIDEPCGSGIGVVAP